MNIIKRIFKPRLKFVRGTRFLSVAFILISMIIAAGVLFAANVYYNLDTGEVVTEEIQRVTQLIRATGGLIAGGSAADTLGTGIKLEVSGGKFVVGTTTAFRVESDGKTYIGATTSLDNTLSFTGASDGDIGFKTPASVGTSTAKYYLLPQHGTTPPSADYVLTWQAGDQLTWKSLSGAGAGGDITAVGDVSTGAAFTADGGGNTLYFEGSSADAHEVILTAADATSDKTITLPDLTGTVGLTTGGLGSGFVLFSTSSLIATSSDFYWDIANSRLGIGTTSPDYALDVIGAIRGTSIRISGAGAGEVTFSAPNMASDTDYTWPNNDGDSNQVLTSNGSGGLTWQSLSGVGGVSGQGVADRLVKWTGASTMATSSIADYYTSGVALTIGSVGTSTFATSVKVLGTLDPNYVAGYTLIGNIVGSGTPSITGIGGISAATATLSTWVKAPTFTSSGTTTISSDASKGIVLDPASGKIKIASGDYIETDGGYEIGKSGTQVLKEMIPILGFDFPVRCGAVCETATTVSRTIEDYPFSSAASGATRVHKFVIRYADSTTTASSTWTVWNDTTSTTTSTFTVPASASTSLGKGEAYITGAVTIPTDTNDWKLKMQVSSGTTIQVYDIYLAAYDQIN